MARHGRFGRLQQRHPVADAIPRTPSQYTRLYLRLCTASRLSRESFTLSRLGFTATYSPLASPHPSRLPLPAFRLPFYLQHTHAPATLRRCTPHTAPATHTARTACTLPAGATPRAATETGRTSGTAPCACWHGALRCAQHLCALHCACACAHAACAVCTWRRCRLFTPQHARTSFATRRKASRQI